MTQKCFLEKIDVSHIVTLYLSCQVVSLNQGSTNRGPEKTKQRKYVENKNRRH